MKEIDFIPEWYRANQTRRRRYHRQYALLGVLLAVLVGWNFVIGRYVSRAAAEAEAVQSIIDTAGRKAEEAAALQNAIADMGRKAAELETLAPRTKTSAIMAELSYLTGDNIILSKLTLTYEPIDVPAAAPKAVAGAVVSVTPPSVPAAEAGFKPVRMKAVLGGISAMPADAASLIYRLEQSEYFEQAVPTFTRTKKVKDYEVTEFEIRCYVSDYKVI